MPATATSARLLTSEVIAGTEGDRVKISVQYDQGDEGGKVYLIVRCTEAPIGSAVALECATRGPEPPVAIKKTPVTTQPQFSVAELTLIPANWHATIDVYWYPEGRTPPPGMTIQLDAIMPINPDSDPQRGILIGQVTYRINA